MSFSIKATCQHGDLVHRRKTADDLPEEGPGDVAGRLLRHHHHDARGAGLPLFRVRRFAPYARRCARAPENSPAQQANSDVASREIAPRFSSQTGTKCDLFDYPLLIRKIAHGR